MTVKVDLVDKEGYVHGWVCVKPPCGEVGSKVFHAEHGIGSIVSKTDKGRPIVHFSGKSSTQILGKPLSRVTGESRADFLMRAGMSRAGIEFHARNNEERKFKQTNESPSPLQRRFKQATETPETPRSREAARTTSGNVPPVKPGAPETTTSPPKTASSHADLLEARRRAREQYPQGHPERLKAERAVRQSRKSRSTAGLPGKQRKELSRMPASSATLGKRSGRVGKGKIDMSAKTPVLASTPHPYGKAGGPGLYNVKGLKHSDYFENIVAALRRSGHSKAGASKIAWSAIRRWAAGGGNVHPEVRAAARAALAEEEKARAEAKATVQNSQLRREALQFVRTQVVELIDPYHQPAGASGGTGGQFAPKNTQSGSKQNKSKVNRTLKGANKQSARRANAPKRQLRAEARQLREKAAGLRSEIQGLAHQLSALGYAPPSSSSVASTSAQKAAASNRAAAKARAAKTPAGQAGKGAAAKGKSTGKHTSSPRAQKAAQLTSRIRSLRTQVASLETRANALDRQATQLSNTAGRPKVRSVELVGAEGYIHGWICERPPCGKVGGKVSHPDYGEGDVVRYGTARFKGGVERQLGMRRRIRGQIIAPGQGGQTPSQFVHPATKAPMGNSEIGDTFEALFKQKGAHLLVAKYGGPYHEIAHKTGGSVRGKGIGSRTTPLDFRLDDKYGGELKTLNAVAKNQKTAIKAEAVARKVSAAREAGVEPLLAVQVVDMATGTIRVYAWPGYVSKKVSTMEYLGSYNFTRADFRKAQQATGHWDKRHQRKAVYEQQGAA